MTAAPHGAHARQKPPVPVLKRAARSAKLKISAVTSARTDGAVRAISLKASLAIALCWMAKVAILAILARCVLREGAAAAIQWSWRELLRAVRIAESKRLIGVIASHRERP
jgi:hypothetical protein